MSNALTIIRSLVIYSLCLPLAIYLGYVLALPMDKFSFTVVVIALFLPFIPILLKWHHLLLFACWNTSVALFFLPGNPNLWLVMTGVSFLLAVLQHILNRNNRLLNVPSLIWPLVFLTLVILVTAQLTGGLGFRLFGGTVIGGKRYFIMLGAILGYFAMTFFRIPKEHALAYVALYFFGTLTFVVGSLSPWIGPVFPQVYMLFPAENILGMMGGASDAEPVFRLGGIAFSALAVCYFLLARHGIREIFSLGESLHFLPLRLQGGFGFNQPYRLLLFLGMIWVSLLGGYRSVTVIIGITFLVQFHLERLWRSQLLFVFIFVGVLGGALALPLVHKLPITIQRSLSFLPLDIDPVAKVQADSTTDWRIRLWKSVLPMVPQYLIVGKGYSMNANEIMMATEYQGTGYVSDVDKAVMSGDFHNGPLTLIIHLGIFGVIGFLWFVYAGYRVLLNNLRFGDPDLHQINVFLMAYFIARFCYFVFIFGAFHGELAVFTGLLGLSISLNGGVARPRPAPVEKPAFAQLKLARAVR